MTTELQNKAWNCLPREFREEVKYEYRRVATKATKDEYDLGFMHAHEGMFGIHNLTSDAEGEEMLCVSRKEVMRNFAEKVAWKNHHQSSKHDRDMAAVWCNALHFLFGSKCLPDEEPTFTDDCQSQEKSQNELRLKIAAMAMQAIITRADMVKWARAAADEYYGRKVCSTYRVVAKAALAFADDLIDEAESPFEPEATNEKGGDE